MQRRVWRHVAAPGARRDFPSFAARSMDRHRWPGKRGLARDCFIYDRAPPALGLFVRSIRRIVWLRALVNAAPAWNFTRDDPQQTNKTRRAGGRDSGNLR